MPFAVQQHGKTVQVLGDAEIERITAIKAAKSRTKSRYLFNGTLHDLASAYRSFSMPHASKGPIFFDFILPVRPMFCHHLTLYTPFWIWHGSSSVLANHPHGSDIAEPLSKLFYDAMWINVILAVFNLIPLPPLVG